MKQLTHTYQKFLFVAFFLFILVSLYVMTVIWRVGVAESDWFGRSTLIPLSFTPPPYKQLPSSGTFGSNTYTFRRPDGKDVKVYKQLINGFQHTYGSALVSCEFGNLFSDYLFRANEYCESYLFSLSTSLTYAHSLDTRKDLINNSIGRSIGERARHLPSDQRYQFILTECLREVDQSIVLPHFLDSRVERLPSASQLGCPCLRADFDPGV